MSANQEMLPESRAQTEIHDKSDKAKLFCDTCNITLKKCIESMRNAYTEEFVKRTKSKPVRLALTEQFKTVSTQLQDQCKAFVDSYAKNQGFSAKFKELEEIIESQKDVPKDHTAWRPTGVPALDVEPHLAEINFKYCDEIEKLISQLKQENSELKSEVDSLQKEYMEVKSQLSNSSA